MRGCYFITDADLSLRGNISDVKEAVAAGVKVIQYRDKNKNTAKMYKEALILRKICRDAIFLINDRVDIALAVGADGVHLGSDDFPYSIARKLLGKNKIIGLTAHNLGEAIKAQRIGAAYLGVSPIFSTNTKSDAGKPAGVQLIKEIKQRVSIPIIAIGGISLSNAAKVIQAGADGLCAISVLVSRKDVKAEINKFQELFLNN
jgi:thiamine-phosphate pyrophosphorylase